ncbi:unnamed protein product [Caenorhabditis angaria]|uniref:Uncharacterized protein n=1 Tax=Caenorhabditis angaria TaxID=860376 RepID=A0A9P1IWP1_9PELO|nr:unnamed protein product [Caenorhabditis angaria]
MIGTTFNWAQPSNMFSYFNPSTSPDENIPNGIVRKRRQIFVDTTPDENHYNPRKNLHIFETPTTSSDDSIHSIRRVTLQEVPRVRVLPPPSYAKAVKISPRPIWINSGPPEESNPIQKTPKTHLITRFDRYSPSLTINVSSRQKVFPPSSISNESWSCKTDWKYFESSRTPTLREARRMENIENDRHMALDNISLGSSRRTSDDHGSVASDSSQIMSMSEQIVRYNSNNNPSSVRKSQSVEDSIMAERETALVVRLERELTEAQSCNHRLNQQLKILANSGNQAIKKELTETKVS